MDIKLTEPSTTTTDHTRMMQSGTIVIHRGPAKVGDQVLAGRMTDDGSPVILRPATIVDDSHSA